jgi:hypothetical protein
MRRSAWIGLVLLVCCASASAAPPGVIPWQDVHPVKASANPPVAPPCQAHDLEAHLFLQGATGSLVGGVNLVNAGSSSCSLVGWPTLTFAGHAASVEKWQVKKLAASPSPPEAIADPPGSLRALQPGKTAGVAIFWSNWCGPGSTATGAGGDPPAAMVIGLGSGTSLAVPVAHAPRCDAPRDPSTVSIGPFTPAPRHLPESSRLPLRATIIGVRTVAVKPGLRAFLVHRGELFHYQVALTNTGATTFRFDSTSCPSYIEQIAPAPEQVYVLNCRPVGVIAAGETVDFAMHVVVPQTARAGNNSLTWELAPRTYEPPFTPAALWITP